MEVSHILVDTEEKAKEVRDKLLKGGDFATLAKEYSSDTVANQDGGSLGEIPYDSTEYDATFMAATLPLQVNEISQPVQTKYGWHIIKVTKRNEYRQLSYDEAKEQIKASLLQTAIQNKLNDTYTQWEKDAKVEKFEKYLNNTK
jgi:foldase protein PrsA